MSFPIRVPSNAPPPTPGEYIEHEFLRPLGITQQRLADAMRVSRVRLNGILKGRRAITPDTALRLERVLGASAEFWLRLQLVKDLYEAQHGEHVREIRALHRLVSA